MESLRPPATVVDIARALMDTGYETWCVGGAVRDALLGHPHLDWDLATAATPDQMREVFGKKRTIPVGIEHGTMGILDKNGVMHEVTTFRHDVDTDGRHAKVAFGASLDEDLARRDFTINAIAFHPITRELRDPFEGQKDLDAKLLRAVGEPHERMREDRLRALRAIRFASRFNFTVDDNTWRAVKDSAPMLTRLSAERVQQELVKTMEQVVKPSNAFKLWKESGALKSLIPALSDVTSESLSAVDAIAVPDASRRPDRADSRRALRLAALFLPLGGEQAKATLKQLKFSNDRIAWISRLVQHARTVETQMRLGTERGATDADIRRWAAATGRTTLSPVVRLVAAMWSARTSSGMDAPAPQAIRNLYKRGLKIAYRDPIEIGDLAIDGTDLQEDGLPPGPRLGQILRSLLDVVIEDPSRNTRDELLGRARLLATAPSSPAP